MRAARAAVVAAALGVASLGGLARADTPVNAWEAVSDPAAAERTALHFRVREIQANAPPQQRIATLTRVRTMLEEAHAEESPDVRLRFDLGEVYAGLENNVRAVAILQPALELAPDDPAALSASIALVNAYARLDRSEEERRVYERFLPKVTDEAARSTAMLNFAEARMHLGELEEAVSWYRATVDLAAQLPNVVELSYHTGALAVWGLAAALDRSGDVPGGAKEAKLAVVLDRDMGIIRLDPNVYFVPARERNWYVALGFIEYAKEAEDARSAANWWARAEGCWREYIKDATDHGGKDRWIELARTRLERARAQRMVAERRVKGRVVYPQYECVR